MSYEAAIATARGDGAESQQALTRQLEIDGVSYLLQVSPLAGSSRYAWRFSLSPALPDGDAAALVCRGGLAVPVLSGSAAEFWGIGA